MNDEIPPEENEVVDQNATTEEDEGEIRRAEEELSKSRDELRGFDVAGVTHLLEALDKALEKSDEKIILELLWRLDQSELMIGLRNWWDRRSSFVQKILFRQESVYPPLFRYLVGFGFLELKGVPEAELEKDEKKRVFAIKWGLRIGSLIVPALRPFQPLFEVLIKLEEKRVGFGKISRLYLVKRREEEVAKEDKEHRKAA